MTFQQLGDNAITVRLAGPADAESAARVAALARDLLDRRMDGVIEIVPVYDSLTIFYDAVRADADRVIEAMSPLIAQLNAASPRFTEREAIEIPVRYGGEFGPDLDEVARRAGLSPREVIELHCSVTYTVGAVGFMPGFAYLLGMPARLHTPRRDSPRTRVPAGSVAIGGAQTGVYPSESPGGWNVIGRTAVAMFDPTATPPARLCVGDRVRFKPTATRGRARCG